MRLFFEVVMTGTDLSPIGRGAGAVVVTEITETRHSGSALHEPQVTFYLCFPGKEAGTF